MPFCTINARYPGTCRRCGGKVEVGQRIRYGGKGQVYHLKAECEGAAPAEDEAPRRMVAERFGTPCGCEDFPCCGCYGLHGRELYTPSEPPEPPF
jgi:hypothetical protein